MNSQDETPQAPTQALGVLAPAAAVVIDGTIGPDVTATFGAGNNTFNVQGVRPGRLQAVTVTQDGVGGRTITWGGTQAITAPVAGDLQPAAGAAAVTTFLIMGIDPTHVRLVGKLT